MGEEKKKLIRSDEAQVLLLDRMLDAVRKLEISNKEIKQTLDEQVPEGVTDPIEPVTVTSTTRLIRPMKPWFNCSIVNGGPDTVKVLVNSEKSFEWHSVEKDETYQVDMGRPLIKDVLLQCEPNETATVRLVGTR
jgi:hypothetical protein